MQVSAYQQGHRAQVAFLSNFIRFRLHFVLDANDGRHQRVGVGLHWQGLPANGCRLLALCGLIGTKSSNVTARKVKVAEESTLLTDLVGIHAASTSASSSSRNSTVSILIVFVNALFIEALLGMLSFLVLREVACGLVARLA